MPIMSLSTSTVEVMVEFQMVAFFMTDFGDLLDEIKLNILSPNSFPTYRNICLPFVLIDEAFPLKENLMKPYPGKQIPHDEIFNYRLCRARRIVENVFGILASRFQALQSKFTYELGGSR
nr:unnamed protein product [Callosobruchus analis]